MGISKVLVENDFQAWLQASGFALSFDTMSPLAKYKMLASLAVGLMSATSKSLQGLVNAIPLTRTFEAPLAAIPIAGNLLSLVVVAWVSAKLFYAYHCPHHLWNISSGCVTGSVA